MRSLFLTLIILIAIMLTIVGGALVISKMKHVSPRSASVLPDSLDLPQEVRAAPMDSVWHSM